MEAALPEMPVESKGLAVALTLDQRKGGGVDVAPSIVVVALEDPPGVALDLLVGADQLDRAAGPDPPAPLDRLLAADPDQQRRVGLREDVVGGEQSDAVGEQSRKSCPGLLVLALRGVAQRDEVA